MKSTLWIYIVLFFLVGCASPSSVEKVEELPPIYPDYADVTIPINIAPLNFLLRNNPESVKVELRGDSLNMNFSGSNSIVFPIKKWKKLLKAESKISVQVTAKMNGKWIQYAPFSWNVVPDSIDSYLSYRSIEPGYEVWNAIQIRERNIQNFDERVLADNNLLDNACMNCHIYGKNEKMQLSIFHLRSKNGGTYLSKNGKLKKLTLREKDMVSAAVYGDFHPAGQFAVFSSNIIIPEFHVLGYGKLEVYDSASDVFVADLDNVSFYTSPLLSSPKAFETFPVFSANGKWIYFCSAPFVDLPQNIDNLKYNLCRIAFDAKTKTFGSQVDTLFSAERENASVCHLKCSPDGKYLLFTVADYGTFPIWHKEADLNMMDLRTGKIDTLAMVNADYSDTYHSWSSNSRWFVFASKRGDGIYGKPYFCYVDSKGVTHKPFVLPQKDPSFYDFTLKSFNIPELSSYQAGFDACDVEMLNKKH